MLLHSVPQCVPLCAATACGVHPVLQERYGRWGQQIQESARRGTAKQMLVQGHNLRLLDEARQVGHQRHPGPEKQDSQHMLSPSSML